MGKKNAKRQITGSNITAALLVFGLGVGLTFTLSASAVPLPPDTYTPATGVRDIEDVPTDFSDGVDLIENTPDGTPGNPTTQPVPKFSLINTPAIVNEEGPLEIPDDLRIYGLTEVVGGLINNGGAADSGGGGDPAVPVPGDLIVTIPADSPSCDSLPKNSAGNDVTKISLTAVGGNVTVMSITFKRSGTASKTDVTGIYAVDASKGTILSSLVGASTSDATKYVVSFAPNGLLVKDGTTTSIMLKATISSLAASDLTFDFGVNSSSDVVAGKGSASGPSAEIGGTLPTKGKTCVIAPTSPAPPAPPAPTPATPTLIMSPANPVSVAVSRTSTTVTINLDAETANINTTAVDTASVNIKNNQHPERTFDIVLTETGANTHIFTSTFLLNALTGTYKPITRTMEVEMCDDNSIYGRYPASGSTTAGYTLIATPNPRVCGGITPTTIPPDSGGPDAVEAVTLLNPDFAEKSPIAFFGSFIPTAHAATGVGGDADLLHPVVVFDDLYVYGNSDEEPGNLVVNGALLAGDVGSSNQISGNLDLIGGNLTVSEDAEVLGNLTVAEDITAIGAIKADSIGEYYRVSNTTLWDPATVAGYGTTTAFCSSGDILISCNGSSTTYTSVQVIGSRITTNGCETKFYRSVSGTAKNLISEATCFDPDASGERPSKPADPTDGRITRWSTPNL